MQYEGSRNVCGGYRHWEESLKNSDCVKRLGSSAGGDGKTSSSGLGSWRNTFQDLMETNQLLSIHEDYEDVSCINKESAPPLDTNNKLLT